MGWAGAKVVRRPSTRAILLASGSLLLVIVTAIAWPRSNGALAVFRRLDFAGASVDDVSAIAAACEQCRVFVRTDTIVVQLEVRRGLVTTTYSKVLGIRDGTVISVREETWNTSW